MERVTDFTETKVGDRFVINPYRFLRPEFKLVYCEKVTPKRVVIGGWAYEKVGGRGIKANKCEFPPGIFKVTPEIIQQLKIQTKRSKLDRINLSALADDQINRIYDIVMEGK